MSGVAPGLDLSFDSIYEKLTYQTGGSEVQIGGRTRASVAMILGQGPMGIEVLFIQRAAHDLDPWSGHIAFPGGKLEEGELECQAACRETYEEVGIDLTQGRYLGRLPDIVGANLPVRVSCCLFSVDLKGCRPVLNEEVCDLFWVSLTDLCDPIRHQQNIVAFEEKRFEVPSIQLPVENKPVLWGITYRLVMQFLSVLDVDGLSGVDCSKLPETAELDTEVTEYE